MKWILLIMVFVTTTAFAEPKAPAVVATVGTKKITLEEFNKKYAEVTSQVLVSPPTKKVFLMITIIKKKKI